MINKNKELLVKNRSAMRVVYSIPNLHISRDFAPGQSMMLTYHELENLSFQPGGKTLMAEFLLITDPAAPKGYSNPTVEPEYYYDDAEVINLLQKGSLDEFLDALDFAPVGVIDLIKKYAIELPLNDVNKREALKEKKNYDVTAIIENSKPDKDEAVAAPNQRRVKKAVSSEEEAHSTSKRRTRKAATAE